MLTCADVCSASDARRPESALVHNTDVSRQKGEQLLEAHCKTSGKSTQASDGLFLLRASAKTKGAVVISMLCSSKSHHFNFGPSGSVENPPRYLNDSGRNVGTVHELIAHYKRKYTCLSTLVCSCPLRASDGGAEPLHARARPCSGPCSGAMPACARITITIAPPLYARTCTQRRRRRRRRVFLLQPQR